MAGPWFTVQEETDGWQTLERIWLSNGKRNVMGEVQEKIRLLGPQEGAWDITEKKAIETPISEVVK